MLICCGQKPVWIENVPGRGYNYCTECKNEVLTPVEEAPTEYPYTTQYYRNGKQTTFEEFLKDTSEQSLELEPQY